MATYEFEKRTGNHGYVWATGSNGCRYEIYLQYGNVTSIPNKKESKLDFATMEVEEKITEEYPVIELSAEEKASLVSQARAFDLASVEAAQIAPPAAESANVPANVLALVARYGSSQAAWEDENETACFQMRAYGY